MKSKPKKSKPKSKVFVRKQDMYHVKSKPSKKLTQEQVEDFNKKIDQLIAKKTADLGKPPKKKKKK